MESTDSLLETYYRQGYVIIRDVLDAAEIDATRAALQPYLDLGMSGRNNFEGVEYAARLFTGRAGAGRGSVRALSSAAFLFEIRGLRNRSVDLPKGHRSSRRKDLVRHGLRDRGAR